MKKLIYKEGNLLTATDIEVVGHQANCQNTFGAGIARSIRDIYPEAYFADTKASQINKNVLGTFSYANISIKNGIANGSSISRIYNLYGQNLYGRNTRQTNYDALYNALEAMANHLMPTEEDNMMFDFDRSPKVGFPHLMGCGLGGGDWRIVERLIEVAFRDYSKDVMIYKFTP